MYLYLFLTAVLVAAAVDLNLAQHSYQAIAIIALASERTHPVGVVSSDQVASVQRRGGQT